MISANDLIAMVPMLQSISYPAQGHVIQAILDISKHHLVPAGTILCEEGDDSDRTGFLLLTGSVVVYAEGKRVLTVRAPELLGEMHQLRETVDHTATVKTLEESRVLRFEWHDFVNRIHDNALIDRAQEKEIREVFKAYADKRTRGLAPPNA